MRIRLTSSLESKFVICLVLPVLSTANRRNTHSTELGFLETNLPAAADLSHLPSVIRAMPVYRGFPLRSIVLIRKQ
ncbi:hypothetical protein EB796_016180 [Bugula neritina]|uniref:Secreted protein n=1 Tax=Bugula neritina TaxID=10212 RepID=A0A7J7JIQ7_BUGNE|nr:hypothetical protein EB796_016180 [Bugula neritina]